MPKKDKSESNRLKDGLLGAATAGGLAVGANQATQAISRSLAREKRDKKALIKVLKRMGVKDANLSSQKKRELAEDLGTLGLAPSGKYIYIRGKRGKKTLVDVMSLGKFDKKGKLLARRNLRGAFYTNPRNMGLDDKEYKGLIALGNKGLDADFFLHELGHSTGFGSKKAIQNLKGMIGSAAKGSKKLRQIGSVGIAAGAKSARTEKEIEKMDELATKNLLMSAALESPNLIEEARANIRAVGLGKKFGHKVNKTKLLKAYGTYAAGSASVLAPALLAKYYSSRKRQEKKAGYGALDALPAGIHTFREIKKRKGMSDKELKKRDEVASPFHRVVNKTALADNAVAFGLGQGAALTLRGGRVSKEIGPSILGGLASLGAYRGYRYLNKKNKSRKK